MKASIHFNCSTCSALAGEPCRSVGALQREGTIMLSFHVARRRAAKLGETLKKSLPDWNEDRP